MITNITIIIVVVIIVADTAMFAMDTTTVFMAIEFIRRVVGPFISFAGAIAADTPTITLGRPLVYFVASAVSFVADSVALTRQMCLGHSAQQSLH